MQSLAAYSFGADFNEPLATLDVIAELVDEWLFRKGADQPRATDGSFISKSGDGTGQFSRTVVNSSLGALHDIELVETAHTGAMFTTSLQIAGANRCVVVYAALSAAPGDSRVAPVGLYPRCPWIIRALIKKFPGWRFCTQEVPLDVAFDARADSEAEKLCVVLRSVSRRLPLIVVSDDPDESVWSGLHAKVAEHLVGLADVAVVSPESSWVLTDNLGPRDSCYLGAVRLYWPGTRPDGSLPGITWTASRLAAFGVDDVGRNKFLGLLRKEVMSTAALTMVPPALCRDIRRLSEKERIRALEANARDKELDSIIAENADLSERLSEAEKKIQSLQWKLAAASYAQREEAAANDEEATYEAEVGVPKPPEPGETRFYKKVGSGGGVDTLVYTKECQHKESNWKPAFKGDQAEKGLLKLEGRNDWKSIAHCSACTGGGRWRVRW